MNSIPLVSIITTVKNDVKNIEKTIQSVLNQNYINLEYIIIDSTSTDGTFELLKQYLINTKLKIFSESDEHVYHGFNNGILKANGQLIAILNSGDLFFNENVITTVVKYYLDNKNRDNCVFHGAALFLNKNINYKMKYIVKSKHSLFYKYLHMPINHPALFVPKFIYDRYGLFNVNFPITADYEFVLRILNKKVKFIFFKDITTLISPMGISSYTNNFRLYRYDLFKTRSLYLNNFFNNFFDYIILVKYYIKKTIVSTNKI